MDKDQIFPEAMFGKDHWSTLAYAETVMVDMNGFQIGLDAHMRSNRRNYRVMLSECPKPKRVRQTGSLAVASTAAEHGTRLRDGMVIAGHDDWSCVQDLAAAGYFRIGDKVITDEDVQPCATLHLSEKGRRILNELREHKSNGGTFSDFQPKEAALA